MNYNIVALSCIQMSVTVMTGTVTTTAVVIAPLAAHLPLHLPTVFVQFCLRCLRAHVSPYALHCMSQNFQNPSEYQPAYLLTLFLEYTPQTCRIRGLSVYVCDEGCPYRQCFFMYKIMYFVTLTQCLEAVRRLQGLIG